MHDQTASVSFTATAAKDEAVSADEAPNRGAAPDPAGPADLARELEMQGIAPLRLQAARRTSEDHRAAHGRYGWPVVAAGLVGMTWMAIYIGPLGVMIKPLGDIFGWRYFKAKAGSRRECGFWRLIDDGEHPI
jgi:hypothetical protein